MKNILWPMVVLGSIGCTPTAEVYSDTGNDTADSAMTADSEDSAGISPLDTDSDTVVDTAAVVLDVIDDMETGSGRIWEVNGRKGVWYVFNDGYGVQWPPLTVPGEPALTAEIPGGRDTSRRAMHTYGEGFRDWGAGIGLDLNFDGTTYLSVDASSYTGISFWARSGMQSAIDFRLGDVENFPIEWGGICPTWNCGFMTFNLTLDTAWKKYWVFFDENGIDEYSQSTLLNIQFFREDSIDGFDYWIDDVAFFSGMPDCGSAAVCLPAGEKDTDFPVE